MEKLKKLQRILGTAFDIRDTADLVIKLCSIGGATTMITAVVNWIGKTIPPTSLILFGIGLFLLLLAILPRIIPNLFAFFRKAKTTQDNTHQKHAGWMIVFFNRDTNNFPRCIFIHNLSIDWGHLVDDDSYFLIHCDIYSSSVFTIEIGRLVTGHLGYKTGGKNTELEKSPEVISPIIEGLERSTGQPLILRQWVSDSMMNRFSVDGGNEITLVFSEINVMVDSKKPDGSSGPKCRLPLPNEYQTRLPTQVELES